MTKAPRVLTPGELNRALLARQLLLERSRLSVPRAVERVAGLQSQYAPSAYVGLWSRLEGFRREQLTRALERSTVVQGTLMRATIHIVSRADYWPIAEAVRASRRDWWLRSTRHAADTRTIEAAARRVRSFLADAPRTRAEIDERFGLETWIWNGVGLWLDLVRVPPSGTWERRRADRFALAEDRLGPGSVDHSAAVDHLVRRYLGGFGPASRADVASFTGLPASELTPALERLRLRRFLDGSGGELLDLPRAPLPDPDTPAPVRFLGTWDATLLVHARRAQVLPERYRSRVFHTKTPHSVNTFLVDGQVAGTWRLDGGRRGGSAGRVPRLMLADRHRLSRRPGRPPRRARSRPPPPR